MLAEGCVSVEFARISIFPVVINSFSAEMVEKGGVFIPEREANRQVWLGED